MTTSGTSRRTFLGLAAGSALGAFGLSACGTSGPAQPGGAASGSAPAGGAAGTATMWALSGQPNETIRKNAVDAFNKLGKGTIEVTFFQNDPYKAKIRTAIGAGQAPTLIFGWGGGILKSYADASQVEDLTSWIGENAGFKDKFLPSTWGAATFDNKIYAVPIQTTQPIVMYYNKSLFDKAGAQPPTTWDDVMNLVGVFNGQGVAPFSLGGQSKWTSMMWLEYLLDRIGGPDVFDAIFANKANAWSDPAVIEDRTKIQDLVKANGFIKGFSSIAADTNADQALLYTGKAAMMLHGSWVYGSMKTTTGLCLQQPGVRHLPGRARRQGRPHEHRGQPGQLLLHLLQGDRGGEDGGEGLLHRWAVHRRRDRGLDRRRPSAGASWARSKLPVRPMPTFLQSIYEHGQGPPTSSSRGTRR